MTQKETRDVLPFDGDLADNNVVDEDELESLNLHFLNEAVKTLLNQREASLEKRSNQRSFLRFG